jgi:hypothetical protein
MLRPHSVQEFRAVFATSTLWLNPWHYTAARVIPHSESFVLFLLKTRRIAESRRKFGVGHTVAFPDSAYFEGDI